MIANEVKNYVNFFSVFSKHDIGDVRFVQSYSYDFNEFY